MTMWTKEDFDGLDRLWIRYAGLLHRGTLVAGSGVMTGDKAEDANWIVVQIGPRPFDALPVHVKDVIRVKKIL